ncbi:NTP transferase domain-containing protein [Autumnicola musiva]|uniref:Probable molybdenum cofactor guanylyltransferase n=1 Tax=Autumnicola musiva TaxID=3075589 RepID=A0ABU3D7E8_9FLAO|nr:NTP transferase domain-containing protein [Zunongwangia sp. F117]MDT0677285.1 NTP transferase domain-containing protein [Zunongwangia sp. F117]
MINKQNNLYGLVLCGGRSTRMGKDKGLLSYYGESQRKYLYKMLDELCDKVFISLHGDQMNNISADFNTIADNDHFPGPFNGIYSAHRQFPNVAWLVIAIDMPLLREKDLQQLITSRNHEKTATAFATGEKKLPEPLCAIWEPGSFLPAAEFIGENQSGPRRFLLNSDVQLVFPEDDTILMNANTPEESKAALKKIQTSEINNPATTK